jgi:proteasome lid subunit RPN8/RPN11
MIAIPRHLLDRIALHGEETYPNECCGFLLGTAMENGARMVSALLPLDNARESEEQYHRFLIAPQDVLHAEEAAVEQGLDVVGVYHSHPDHPARPSEFDRAYALPWWSYIITAVRAGRAAESNAWTLSEDRSAFIGESVQFIED